MKSYEVMDDTTVIVRFNGSDFNPCLAQMKEWSKEYLGDCKFRYQDKMWVLHKRMLPILVEAGYVDHKATPVEFKTIAVSSRPAKRHDLKVPQKFLDTCSMKPYDYQIEGAEWLARYGSGIVTLKMGCGKSLIMMLYWATVGKFFDKPLLLVCPAGLCKTWVRQIKAVLRIKATILPNNIKLLPKGEILIINYENLYKNRMILAGNVGAIVADEAHALATGTSKRYEGFKLIGENCEDVIMLTATPAEANIRMFTLLNLIDSHTWANKAAFIQRYCDVKQTRYGLLYTNKNSDELYKRIKPYIFNKTMEELKIELPATMDSIVEIEIDDPEYIKSSEALAELIDDSADEIEEEIIERLYALSRSAFVMKRSQIFEIIDSKLEDTEDQIVIAYYHSAVGEDICNKYGCNRISGDVDPNSRQQIIDDFHDDKSQRILCLQIVAGGVGFSIRCEHMWFVECVYVAWHFIQCAARIRRVDSPHDTCFYKHFICTLPEEYGDSIDQRMYKRVQQKANIMSTLITGETEKVLNIVNTEVVRS